MRRRARAAHTAVVEPLSSTPDAPGRPQPDWVVRIAVVLGFALIAAHIWGPEGLVREWTYLAVGAGVSVMAWRGARRSSQPQVARWIALGVVSTSLGDLVYQMLAWTYPVVPDISVADLGWVGAYVGVGGALTLVLRSTPGVRLDFDGWVDVGVVTVVALLLQWQLGLYEVAGDTGVPAFVRLVWCLYPLMDALLLALVVRALLARRLRVRPALLLGGGAICWLVSDHLYSVFAPEGRVATWVDAGWLLGAVLLAGAAGQREFVSTSRRSAVGPMRVGYSRAVIGLLPLLIPTTIETVGFARGQDPNPIPLGAASVALVALALLRMSLLMHSDRDARTRLRSEEQRAGAIAANSSDAVAVVDAQGVIRNDARLLALLVGFPESSLQGADLFLAVDPLDREASRAVFERSVQSPGRVFETELRVQRVDGRIMWVAARLVNLLHDPDLRGVIVTLHDITRRKLVEREIEHQAFHDGLTGLANRALFADRVQQALDGTSRSTLHPAVIFLDLDGFKTVNDSLGHAAGDDLLREVARRLVAAARNGETVARLGGDEFAILTEPSRRPIDEACTISERVLQVLSEPIALADQSVRVSASLGIAGGEPESTGASMLRDADIAMYRAKSGGKSRWVVYDAGMRTVAVERLQLETDLHRALEGGQFALVYQPVVELETERVVGFEALLRWHHPTLGVVVPDRFIPLAEESGLILPIGEWVLDEACRTAARWIQAHPHHADLSMAVNVSARQLGSADLVAQVRRALTVSGLDPANLVIEMTETALIQDASVATPWLQELHDLGVRLAIDDFGTGYSSLSYLRQFPIDILKIDRSFIESITDPDNVPAIVRGLLDLGRTLQLQTIAEGVEDGVQRDRLRDERCDLAQGYLFARPLDEADAELLLLQLDPNPRRTALIPATQSVP